MALHQLWDKAFDPTGVGGGDEDGDVLRLHAIFASAAAKLDPHGNFPKWLDESEALARARAYTGPAVLAAHAPADAPAMTSAYMTMLRRIAERRVITAGVRLGMMLKGLR